MKFILSFIIFTSILSCTENIDSNTYHSLNNSLGVRYQRISGQIENDSLSETNLFKALNILRVQNDKNCDLGSISLDVKIPYINIDTTFSHALDLLVFEDSLLVLMEDLYLDNQIIFNFNKPFFVRHQTNENNTYYKVYTISFDSTVVNHLKIDGDIELENGAVENNIYFDDVKIRSGLIDSSLLKGEYWMNTNENTYKYRLEDIKVLN